MNTAAGTDEDHRGGARPWLAALGIGACLMFAGCGDEQASAELDGELAATEGSWWAPAAAEVPAAERPARLAPAPEEPLPDARGKLGRTLEADDLAYFRRPVGSTKMRWQEHPRGGFQRTFTGLGVRRADPLPDARPERLVIVTGDSHVDGVVSDDEVLSYVLEQRMRAEGGDDAVVLNAACGFYTFPNYLGVAARFTRLAPDAFVMIVYGGNDFGALVPMQRALDGQPPVPRPDGYRARIDAARGVKIGERLPMNTVWQALNQVVSLEMSPELVDETLELALDYTRAIQELCEASGTRFLVVYLPPAHDADQAELVPYWQPVAEAMGLDQKALQITDRLATRYLDGAASEGVEVLDARPAFRGAGQKLYWITDEHIDVAGHRLLAELIGDALENPR